MLGYRTSSEVQINIGLAGIRLSCLATGTVAPRSTSTVPQKTQHPVGKGSSVRGGKNTIRAENGLTTNNFPLYCIAVHGTFDI